MTKSIFKDFTSKPPAITGVSTINHAIRVKLRLTADEYIFMIYLDKLKTNRKPIEDYKVYAELGYVPNEISFLLNSLMQQGFILPAARNAIPKITDKWDNINSYQKEFEKFWTEPLPDGKTKAAWKGSKPETIKLYNTLRKRYPQEYLLKQRNDYFIFLRLQLKYQGFDQARMGAPVFLNMEKQRFAEPWGAYIKELENKHKPKPTEKPVTIEQLKKAYDK